jgi:hypothetical protein
MDLNTSAGGQKKELRQTLDVFIRDHNLQHHTHPLFMVVAE